MTSSTKPEVHNISYHCHSRTYTCVGNSRRLDEWFRRYARKQTHAHTTNTLITILRFPSSYSSCYSNSNNSPHRRGMTTLLVATCYWLRPATQKLLQDASIAQSVSDISVPSRRSRWGTGLQPNTRHLGSTPVCTHSEYRSAQLFCSIYDRVVSSRETDTGSQTTPRRL